MVKRTLTYYNIYKSSLTYWNHSWSF
jgi:hypothetical protein